MENNKNQQEIKGVVEKVVYYNAENGYGVLNVKLSGQGKDGVAVVGIMHEVSSGEQIQAIGNWFIDKKFGKQFKIEKLKSILPNQIEGIKKYLCSGLINGIGPHYAGLIVAQFGVETFDVIDKEPHRLLELRGIGKMRVDKIKKSWQEQKIIKDIMVFLQAHSVSNSLAIRIYKAYGHQAIEIVKENPYCLARDIPGIGFLTADKIAVALGVEPGSPYRAKAGIDYALSQNTVKGNSVVSKAVLQKEVEQLLNIPVEIINIALQELINEKTVVDTSLALSGQVGDKKIAACAISYLFNLEQEIAKKLMFLSQRKDKNKINCTKAIEYAQSTLKITLSENQKEAIKKILIEQVIVITGGPGTGKTTLLNSAVKILQQAGLNVMLCAPTGKAARRLSEVSGCEASTIHRLLGISSYSLQATNQEIWHECDVLIVDEVSMVNISLMHAVTNTISNKTKLILVGDVNQLPPIGAGKPLADIIDSNVIPVVKLDKIFRQAEAGMIVVNAHKINSGIVPDLTDAIDFKFLQQNDNQISFALAACIENLAQKYDYLREIQILTPMRKTESGTIALNNTLQKSLNKQKLIKISRFGSDFYNNDKVMQIVNNYTKEVYNGDVGIVTDIDLEEQIIFVDFDDKKVSYEFNELDQLILAYASTIHKSQGSEYKVVIIPMSMQHKIMLSRKLLYTALTRAKELVIIIGSQEAIKMAVYTTENHTRFSKLKDFLENAQLS
jgi:exodeoxyribonuclease V alpha subunit